MDCCVVCANPLTESGAEVVRSSAGTADTGLGSVTVPRAGVVVCGHVTHPLGVLDTTIVVTRYPFSSQREPQLTTLTTSVKYNTVTGYF